MEETLKNNKQISIGIGGIITRLFVFGMIWLGIFHLYITVLDTNWYLWADILSSFSTAWIPLYNKGFSQWFFNNI